MLARPWLWSRSSPVSRIAPTSARKVSLFANLFSRETRKATNCHATVFDRTQYAISDQPNMDTFEYRSCLIGCNKCSAELAANAATDDCLESCKNYDYKGNGIRKGVIEPDKACMIGCVINTCQEVCIGGTTDMDVTPANQNLWWGKGGPGCSIKTGLGYVQAPGYGNPNSPGGQAGDSSVQQCCTNAFNLCNYVGPKTTTNFKNVQIVTKSSCKKFVKPYSDAAACVWYSKLENCGSEGMLPP